MPPAVSLICAPNGARTASATGSHLAYKPEHALDLDTGAVVAAEIHSADRGDTATLPDTLESAARHLAVIEAAPSAEVPAEMVTDKGYHSRETLKSLDDGPWKNRIAEPKRDGFLRCHSDDAAADRRRDAP